MTALDALHRARRAWEATQPQFIFDLDSTLDEQPGTAGAPSPAPSLPAGLLIDGRERRRERRHPAVPNRRPRMDAHPPTPLAGRRPGAWPRGGAA